MTNHAGGDIITDNEIEVRCVGIMKDGRPCNHKFFVGSPGFDIYGKPKVIVTKCPKCKNYIVITCEIEEKVIVRVREG